MARTLLTLQPGVGHLTPMVPLAHALRLAGHDVRLGSSRRFGPIIEAAGLTAVALGLDWLESQAEANFPGFLDSAGDVQVRIMAGAPAPALAADVVALAQTWRPDMLVRDCWEFGGWAAAEEIGIPSVVYGVSARLPPPRLVSELGAQLAALRAARRLPPDPALTTVEGRLFLDTTPPALEFIPHGPSETHVVKIRPVYDDTRGPQPRLSWFSESDGQSMVFATLGTVNNRNQVLLTKLLEAVADEDYQVLLALGDTPTAPDPVPSNVHVERYVPVSQALSTCAAVVSHAGRGTVLTALSQGVPVCSIPLTADQPVTASLVERFGAGLTCATGRIQMGPFALPVADPHQLDPLQLRQQIRRVLTEPAFAEQARTLQAEIAELPGPDQVVHMLDAVLEATRAQAPPG